MIKSSRIIPESERMEKLVAKRSDIRMWLALAY